MGTCKFPSLHPCFPHLCLFLASQSLPLKTQGKEARREELAEKRFISFPEYIIANRFSAKGCVNPINDVCEGGFPVSSLRLPQGSLLAPLSRNKSTGTAFMMADQDDFRVKQGSWNDDIRELSICVLSSILLRDWFNQIKKLFSQLPLWHLAMQIILFFVCTNDIFLQTLASMLEINVVQPAIDHLKIIVCRCTGSQCSSSPCRCNLSMKPRPCPRAPTMFWLIVPVRTGHLGLPVILHITHICPNKGTAMREDVQVHRSAYITSTHGHTQTHTHGHEHTQRHTNKSSSTAQPHVW